ncbi:hypothetical protein HY745_07420, partial [Candidatus Desantisbacteria bacterium]|nr:hypothetical protein [Candidatus Desantisbacteria bacterium]
NPIDTNADGKVNDFATNENNLTGNAFGYDRSSPTNICTIPVRVKIKPDNAAIQTLFKDKVTVKLDTISNAGFTSNLTWEDAVEGDPSTGNLKYDESLGLWEATAKFNGLPAVPAGSWGRVPKGLRNLLYGKRSAVVTVLNPTGSGNIYVKNESYEVYFGDSLVIGGIKMAETTENFIDHIKTLLMLNTLSTEIYEKMNCSTETFDFADDNKAIDNFLMRLNVISNMKKMDADPKQLDVGYIGDGYDIGGITYKFARAGDTYYYGTGPDYHEGNEWEHNNDYPNYVGIFKKKTGVTSYLAISKIYPFRGECAGAAEICLFQSAIDVYGSDRFNAVHPADFGVGTFLYNNVKKHRSIIWDKSDRNINGGDSTTLVPGDYIYMKNKDDYTENSSGMWAGENCFYYGLDISGKAKFGGLGKGLSDITEEEMRDILEFEYEGEPLNDLDHDGIYDPQDGETYTIIINNGEWDKGDCYDRTVDNPETEIRFTKIGRIKTGE